MASPELTANAQPTKAFFTGMLTRDIELKDAVLDLLDNCVDGLMRTLGRSSKSKKKPYAGYFAHVTFSADHFVIEDNCGGISKKMARDSAFRMGRTEEDRGRDGNLPTVGTYGIGMKRAIFKMGRSCVVTSTTKSEAFTVTIPESWFRNDDNWKFEIKDITMGRRVPGLRIEIRDLLPVVRKQFFATSGFDVEFSKIVAEQFAIIIAKGFEVKVNGKTVKAKNIRFRSVDMKKYEEGIAPFLFDATVDGVRVNLSVGFYKPVPDQGEIEGDDDEEGTNSADEAGWTIICNDRVILSHDKSVVTGWGVSGVPQYHNQFISIAGTVRFSSEDASKLPLTTTKRGVDLNNEIYLRVRDKMIEGTKFFTSFTNKLKKLDKVEKDKVFAPLNTVSLSEIDEVFRDADLKWKSDRQLSGRTFRPNLPELNASRLQVIRYSKPKEEVEEVRLFLFEDETASAGEVGVASFDRVLAEARES